MSLEVRNTSDICRCVSQTVSWSSRPRPNDPQVKRLLFLSRIGTTGLLWIIHASPPLIGSGFGFFAARSEAYGLNEYMP